MPTPSLFVSLFIPANRGGYPPFFRGMQQENQSLSASR